MDHQDHVNLLKSARLAPGGAWADLGAGSGAFTLALRELVGAAAALYAVDKDRGALGELERAHTARFGNAQNLYILPADFTRALELPLLDGVVMANSLHYYKNPKRDANERGRTRTLKRSSPRPPRAARSASSLEDKAGILRYVRSFLRPRGTLLLVEYNVDSGNPWVPYPISFETFCALAPRAGFSEPRLLGRVPSRFLREIYSAVAYNEELKH